MFNYIKKNKYLGINITKEVKDLYLENYKVLMKEISIYVINRWKDILFSWTERINIVAMIIITQGHLQILCNSYQNTTSIFLQRTRKIIWQSVWKHKRPLNSQNNLWVRRTQMEASCFLISYCTTKLQKSKQYCTGTKADTLG